MEYIDKQIILSFFNIDGNIMDFSNEYLSEFSKNIIGKDINNKTLSKGKSLDNFIINEGSNVEIVKLCNGLLSYYKNIYCKNYSSEYDLNEYNEIKSIINKYKNNDLLFENDDNKIQNKQRFIENLNNNNIIKSLISTSEFHFKNTNNYSYYYPNGKKGTWNKIGIIVFIFADNIVINDWKNIKYDLNLIFQNALDFNSKYEVVDIKYRVTNNNKRFNLSNNLSNRIMLISNRDASFTNMAIDEKIYIINNTIEYMLKNKKKYIHIDEAKYFYLITNKEIHHYRKITQCFRHASKKSLKERQIFTNKQRNFLIEYGVMIIKTLDKL